jgi:hypothetical protein
MTVLLRAAFVAVKLAGSWMLAFRRRAEPRPREGLYGQRRPLPSRESVPRYTHFRRKDLEWRDPQTGKSTSG